MKPLRKNVALAIDGGGIRGVLVAKALDVVEKDMGTKWGEICGLTAGTSTGSIIAAGIGLNMPAAQLHDLYCQLGKKIFPKTLRSRFWYVSGYRYENEPLVQALKEVLGERTMGDFWQESKHDVVIVLRDLVENRQRFVKPWKKEYQDWLVWQAVTSSCTVPTYFPPMQGRYIDGGVGSYSNPCYVAAYEATYCLDDWDPQETTLISLGTGSGPSQHKKPKKHYWPWDWIHPILDAFTVDAARQQVHLVDKFFAQMQGLDFRRFQIKMNKSIPMDGVDQIPLLTEYGVKLGHKILNDQWDKPPELTQTTRLGW